VVNPPFRFSGLPVQVSGFSSSLGADTRAVLELAGYAADEIETMAAAGIVRLG